MTDRRGSGRIRALIFDMGGVLVELGEPGAAFGLEDGTDEFLERWLCAPSVRAFERGDINIGSFAARVVAEAGLPYDAGEFIERFMAWPRGLYAGTTALLGSIPGNVQRVLLSNTNPEHWHETGLAAQLTPCLDRVFLSFETGLLKPDAAAFRHVLDSIGCSAEEVALFDDNPLNVDAARQLGCHAVRTRGLDELQQAVDRIINR